MDMAVAADADAQDALLNARISKARSELSQLHRYIGRARAPAPAPAPLAADDGDVAARGRAQSSPAPSPARGFRSLQSTPTSASARLLRLSRSATADDDDSGSSGARTDRMRLAELSVVRGERLERGRWTSAKPAALETPASEKAARTARMSPAHRVQSHTSPRTSAKVLGEYSRDFVTQALDFDNVEDDDEEPLRLEAHSPPAIELPPLRTPSDDGVFVESPDTEESMQSPLELRKYVKQMEETIAQLVQQKDELMHNQAEFDKHASGLFPSLETLNHRLSQLMHGQLNHSQAGASGNAGGMKGAQAEDVLDELRVQRSQIQELEAEAKRRKYDTDLQEQSRVTEMTQIKGQIVSLVTSGKLYDERNELLADSLKKLEREFTESTRGLLQRYQLLDKRVNQLQTPMAQPRLVPVRSTCFMSLRGGSFNTNVRCDITGPQVAWEDTCSSRVIDYSHHGCDLCRLHSY